MRAELSRWVCQESGLTNPRIGLSSGTRLMLRMKGEGFREKAGRLQLTRPCKCVDQYRSRANRSSSRREWVEKGSRRGVGRVHSLR